LKLNCLIDGKKFVFAGFYSQLGFVIICNGIVVFKLEFDLLSGTKSNKRNETTGRESYAGIWLGYHLLLPWL